MMLFWHYLKEKFNFAISAINYKQEITISGHTDKALLRLPNKP